MWRMMAVMLMCGIGAAQMRFEVASVKPSPPGARMVAVRGGPGTADPGRWAALNMPLTALVAKAYGMEMYQISTPAWMDRASFDIQAKVAPGATKEQVWLMLRELLVERFKLECHREQGEVSMYELVVGRRGPKLKEAAPETGMAADTPPGPRKVEVGRDGYPILSGAMTMASTNGQMRWQLRQGTTEKLAQLLSGQLGAPVKDATGLTGQYDMAMYWVDAMKARDGVGPTILTAVEEQLGLKLVSKKGPVEMLVVDRAEKVPSEN